MPDNFGARLRERRERLEIPLATIADDTKIKLSLLEGLERGDVSHWPSGIFRRAFVRTYALAIGLDPDGAVREFLELHPDPIELVATLPAIAAAANGVEPSAGPPTRFRYLVGSAIGSLSKLRSGVALERSTGVVGSAPLPASSRAAASAPADAPLDPSGPEAVSPLENATLPKGAPSVVQESAPVRFDASIPPDPREPPTVPVSFEPDLAAAAQLCTELGRVETTRDAAPLLEKAARILDAVGLIVWVWDPQSAVLRAMLASGYSEQVLAQLPTVRREAGNATAAAFRAGQTCTVASADGANGALVAPLMTPRGCAGVLALELPHGRERTESVRALVAIFAAMLAGWIATDFNEVADRRLA